MIGVRFSENKCCRNSQCKKVLWLSMLLLTSFIIGCEDQERNNVTWGWGSLVERYSFLSDFPAYDGGIAKYDYQEVEDSVLLYVVLDYVDKPFVVAYFKKLEDSGFEMKSDLRIYKKYKENQNYKLIVEVDIMSITFKKIPLTKEPPMDQSDELALSTFEGIDGATAGNYRAVISWYGASFPLTFDVMCGNGMVGPVNTGRMRQEPAWNYTSTSTMGLWSSAYSAILGCNKALTAINEGKILAQRGKRRANQQHQSRESFLASFGLLRFGTSLCSTLRIYQGKRSYRSRSDGCAHRLEGRPFGPSLS